MSDTVSVYQVVVDGENELWLAGNAAEAIERSWRKWKLETGGSDRAEFEAYVSAVYNLGELSTTSPEEVAQPAALDRFIFGAVVADVLAERRRQVTDEGYTPEHDDKHAGGSLAAAAACYAMLTDAHPNDGQPPPEWPWAREHWKPRTYRRDLERAAALLIAELERLERAERAP